MSASSNHPVTAATTMSFMFMACFLLTVFFGALLLQIGSPIQFTNILMLVFLVSGYVFVAIYGRTMGMETFQSTGRMARPWQVAQANASAIISCGVFILLAGDFYTTGTQALSQYWGWLLGIILIVVVLAAKAHRSNAVTLPDMARQQDGTGVLNLLLVCISVLCSGLLIVLNLEFAAIVGQRFLDITQTGSIIAASLAAAVCVIAGGMQSVTIVRQVAYPIILLCFLAPVGWIAYTISGLPIPQFTFGGSALQPVLEINRELVAAGLAQPEEIFDMSRQATGGDSFGYLSALICIACGLAAMPHVLQHYPTLDKPVNARNAGIGTFALVLLFLSAVPAVATFVKLDLYTSLLGLQLSDLPTDANWIFSLSGGGKIPLISLCGAVVENLEQAIAACGETSDYFVSVGDIGINPDFVMLASAALHELPPLMTTLLAIGAMFALMTAIDGLILAIGLTLSNDGYRRHVRPKSPKSVRLFMTRFFIVATIIVTAWLALKFDPDPRLLLQTAFAISAACLFPALVARFWIPELGANAVATGVGCGFVVTATILVLMQIGVDLVPGNGDEMVFAIPLITNELTGFGAGLLGLGVTSGAMALCFLASRYLSKRRETVDVAA